MHTLLRCSLVALLALPSACAPDTNQESRSQRTQVTIAQFGDLLIYLPVYIAHNQGVFDSLGLSAEIVSTGGDDKTYTAVISGDADFGVADPTFPAIAQSDRGKTIGVLIDGVPNYGVTFDTTLNPIEAPSELRSITIATVPAPATAYTLTARLFQSAGLEPSIRQVAFPGLVPALRAGEVDAAVLIEPWVTETVRDGARVILEFPRFYQHFALTGVTTRTALLQANPDIVERFLNGLDRAVAIFYNDPDRSLGAAQLRFPDVAPDVLREALERMRGDSIYATCLMVVEPAWSEAVSLRTETGDIRPNTRVEDFVVNDPARSTCNEEENGLTPGRD